MITLGELKKRGWYLITTVDEVSICPTNNEEIMSISDALKIKRVEETKDVKRRTIRGTKEFKKLPYKYEWKIQFVKIHRNGLTV